MPARAADTVRRLQRGPSSRARFEATGTGLAACSQGAQIAHMAETTPEELRRWLEGLNDEDLGRYKM